MPDHAKSGSSSEDAKTWSQAPGRSGATASEAASGETVGPYRLLQKIGEGGMGEVYLAEQLSPVRRRVALKVIKRGMDTERIVARFETERQALAVMDHACIAKVFDAGVTSRDRPYFVMEYVPGIPITRHCDQHRLELRDRLELFLQVCEGVQHAHQKAIIHRDLKPSNILVTIQGERAVPKIIDFGVAKATAQRLTDRTLFTELGQLIGTPEYMSPEQAEMTGQDVDTRTDVYSLGVVLYELLTGTLPLASEALRGGGLSEIQRKIREDDPPRPSTRVSSADESSTLSAKHRRTEQAVLSRALRGDLDWITMKALEKDRSRRYGSPVELAADLIRYLKHEPIQARPPSTTYRAAKFVRRHRVGVTSAIALVVVLIAFAISMAVQANRIARERDRANREAETAQRVSSFLAEIFKVSDPSEARGNSITAREILDRGAARIREELGEDPLVQARLMQTIGDVYKNLGLFREAQELVEAGLAIRQHSFGPDDPETMTSLDAVARLHYLQNQYHEAETIWLDVLERRRRTLGEDHPDTLYTKHSLGNLYYMQKRFDQAQQQWREALEGERKVLGDEHPRTVATLGNLGLLEQELRHLKEAEKIYLEVIDAHRRTQGEDHPDTLHFVTLLAGLYQEQGRLREAEETYRKGLEAKRRVLGEEHPETVLTMSHLAFLYDSEGRDGEAEALWQGALEIRRRLLGEHHRDTLVSKNYLASLYRHTGRYDQAEPLLREALAGLEGVGADVLADVLINEFHTACVLAARGNPEAALELLERTVQRGRDTLRVHAEWRSTLATIASDSDLAALRGNSSFEAVAAEVTRRLAAFDAEAR